VLLISAPKVRGCIKTLRVTPAMEAGLAEHIWSIAELMIHGLE
jgi:hypothetical protein